MQKSFVRRERKSSYEHRDVEERANRKCTAVMSGVVDRMGRGTDDEVGCIMDDAQLGVGGRRFVERVANDEDRSNCGSSRPKFRLADHDIMS